MKITQLSYARLLNTGDFENRRIEATALLAEGDDPGTTMAALRLFVDTQIEEIERAAFPWKYPAPEKAAPEGQEARS